MLKLSVYDMAAPIKKLGPGDRFGLWTQGCPFRCKGCITPLSQPLDTGRDISIEDIKSEIQKHSMIEGLTISGGEPFLQAASLSKLSHWAQMQGLGIIVFTGYTIEVLRMRAERNPAIAAFLSKIDLLVDGQYLADLKIAKGFKGSENQRLHMLSDRYVKDKAYFTNYSKQTFEHIESTSGSMYVGIPSQAIERIWNRNTTTEKRESTDEWIKKYQHHCQSE